MLWLWLQEWVWAHPTAFHAIGQGCGFISGFMVGHYLTLWNRSRR
jgi:hypothetical protein